MAVEPLTPPGEATTRILRLAHRGDWRSAPENSLAALVAGARAPRSDGLEFDVHLSADGTPVVIHDPSLARVQGVDGQVATIDTGVLASLGVPTLADVLTALPSTAFLDVELKVTPNATLTRVLEAARGRAPADAVVSSYLPDALIAVTRRLPRWQRWLNSDWLDAGVIERARSLECRGISAQWRSINPKSARMVREAGLDLVAFTVRREATVRRLEHLGVWAVCVEGRPLD
ncbi:MAG: glycerophosphodiester phosphodiesterase [Candidatus Limnocylindrales bacterium]